MSLNKRKQVVKIARRLLSRKGANENPRRLMVVEPPQEFLEENVSDGLSDQRLPKEILFMLKSIR